MTPVGLVLEKLGLQSRRQGRRWWTESCPLPTHGPQNPAHRYQNFFIRDDESEERPGQFWCFSCHNGGVLVQFVEAVRGCNREEARAWLASIGDRPPPPVLRVRFDPTGPRMFRLPAGVEFAPLSGWNSVAREYAMRRGITAEQVERWGVGVAHEGKLKDRIVFPIRDQNGRVANYSARTFVDDPVRYLAASTWERPDLSVMWGEEMWIANRRDVVVVFEGVVNGLAIERALGMNDLWPDASVECSLAALQGSDVDHRKLAKLATFGMVVDATDPDTAGARASRQLFASLGRRDRKVVRLPYPDKRDAAELEPGFLRQTIFSCLIGRVNA